MSRQCDARNSVFGKSVDVNSFQRLLQPEILLHRINRPAIDPRLNQEPTVLVKTQLPCSTTSKQNKSRTDLRVAPRL
jgi:hypothetical protein